MKRRTAKQGQSSAPAAARPATRTAAGSATAPASPTTSRRHPRLLWRITITIGATTAILVPVAGLFIQKEVARIMMVGAAQRLIPALRARNTATTPLPWNSPAQLTNELDHLGPAARRHLHVQSATSAGLAIQSRAWPATCWLRMAPGAAFLDSRCGWTWQRDMATPLRTTR